MTDHTICILGSARKVKPGAEIVAIGDRVFYQAFDTSGWIIFPEDRCPFDQARIPVPRDGSSPAVAVVGRPGAYPYTVYLVEANSFASGDSDPIIIIKRPNQGSA
jgi:hypothetical protein